MTTVAAEAPPPAAVRIDALDPEAFFVAHYESLCRTAMLVLGDAALAEELVMDAFAQALSKWRRVEAADAPVAYVRRMVVNLCVSRVRRFAVERRLRTRLVEPPTEAEDAADADLLSAVAALPPRQRACVVLRYFDDLAEADIAAALGCSVGTVKSQLAKARASLARVLEERQGR